MAELVSTNADVVIVLDDLDTITAVRASDGAFIQISLADFVAGLDLSGVQALPAGGTTLQVLAKVSDDNYDADWTTIAVGGGGPTGGVHEAQVFSPDAGEVTAGTADFTLVYEEAVLFVKLNGLDLQPSEYSLTGTVLTVTPDDGYASTSDVVLVYQTDGSPASPEIVEFLTPLTVWDISHGLGRYPTLQAFSSGGLKMNVEIQHISLNQAQITHLTATAGFVTVA